MNKSIETNDSLSLFAGLWFFGASYIPVIFTFLISPNPNFSFTTILLYVIVPVSITFFLGCALGSDILNPNKVKTSKAAIIEGVKIALSSFVIFILLFALCAGFYQIIFERNLHEFLTVDFVKNFLFGLALAGVFGSIMIGWLVLLVGAIAGWLLFRYRLFSVQKGVS